MFRYLLYYTAAKSRRWQSQRAVEAAGTPARGAGRTYSIPETRTPTLPDRKQEVRYILTECVYSSQVPDEIKAEINRRIPAVPAGLRTCRIGRITIPRQKPYNILL